MTKEKDFPAFDPTITAQTKDGTAVKIGSIAPDFSISLFPDVSFADLSDHTILGSEHMRITTGCLKSGPDK